ncbi:MAG: 3-hydroxybutyryl-CoA dehydrogenase [Candidatus Lambdaproteobacteria bacterium]|nr:3-hydroxybutyryl-CoA dehydrogenase [Candidatus Lambdaproteobacteria bacterium]
MTSILSIGVLGAGQMGNGIAHVAAQSGYQVILCDIQPVMLDRATQAIAANMSREVKRGKIEEAQRTEALARLRATVDVEALAAMDLVIEAVPESLPVKQEVYAQVTPHLKAGALFVTNTSALPITLLASHTPHPERFMGMHFFNPVPMIELVELIPGLATAPETHQAVRAVAEKMGKTPIDAGDSPGFIANRILIPMLNEAIFALHERVGTVEGIDAAMKLGMRHPMGPLTLADYIGLDTLLAICRVLHNEFGDSKYRPCPLLVRLVQAGWLGVKSKRGFYDYTKTPPAPSL